MRGPGAGEVVTSGGAASSAATGPVVGPLLVLLTGVVTLRLALTGAYTAYVRTGMVWLLVPAGVLLAALGGAGLWSVVTARRTTGPSERSGVDGERTDSATTDPDDAGHAHSHARLPAVAGLLLVPLAVVYVVAPPALGAFSAERSSGSTLSAPRTGFAPLEPGPDGVADVGLAETVRRATSDDGATLAEQPVRTTGFVVPDGDGSVLLTRFVIRCCAADGTPAQVRLELPPGARVPAADQWVQVVMTRTGAAPGGMTAFVATSLRPVDQPADPYEV